MAAIKPSYCYASKAPSEKKRSQSGRHDHDQKAVGSNLVSSKILDRNGVKDMPGSIFTPNSGSFEKTSIKIRKTQLVKCPPNKKNI